MEQDRPSPGVSSAHRDRSTLQQPHGHISELHLHLLGPGHTPPAPVSVGHVHAVEGEAQVPGSAGTGVGS